jgi:hypothetical protein
MRGRMFGGAAVLAAALLAAGCGGNNDQATNPTGGSLAQVELGAPDGPVASGASFNVDVKARDVGFSVLHATRVHVVLPPPLVADSAEVSAGAGTAVVANGASGGTVDFDFGTIDRFSQSAGTIHAHGVIPATQNNVKLTVTAQLTSDEVQPGAAVAAVDVLLQH